jgi:hypothetical protein
LVNGTTRDRSNIPDEGNVGPISMGNMDANLGGDQSNCDSSRGFEVELVNGTGFMIYSDINEILRYRTGLAVLSQTLWIENTRDRSNIPDEGNVGPISMGNMDANLGGDHWSMGLDS